MYYDSENRVVSEQSSGGVSATYTYDGDGRRVTKTAAGVTTIFVYDAQGQLAAEYSSLAATTPPCQTCFLTYDHLGSVRLMTDLTGKVIARHDYLPFGEEVPSGAAGRTTALGFGLSDSLSQRFTGQLRDSETLLDYFGARYYGAALGRWTSPDILNVTDDRLLVPSTMNKYAYAGNNPLGLIDDDGLDVTVLFEPEWPKPGHIMYVATNPSNGQSAAMSFGPTDTSLQGRPNQVLGPVAGTPTFDIPKSTDELRSSYAALTIQTSPDEAQEVINFIKKVNVSGGTGTWDVYNHNCTTVCRDALKAIGVLPRDSGSIAPYSLWSSLFQRYAKNPTYATFSSPLTPAFSLPVVGRQTGMDYGRPRYGMNTFNFLFKILTCTTTTASWYENGKYTGTTSTVTCH